MEMGIEMEIGHGVEMIHWNRDKDGDGKRLGICAGVGAALYCCLG